MAGITAAVSAAPKRAFCLPVTNMSPASSVQRFHIRFYHHRVPERNWRTCSSHEVWCAEGWNAVYRRARRELGTLITPGRRSYLVLTGCL